MTSSPQILEAALLMVTAHAGQVRKFTHEPYACHPLRVAQAVARAGANDSEIVAALLHDIIEDTSVTLDDLVKDFGVEIAELVDELTNHKGAGNRADRKAEEVHWAQFGMSPPAKRIRLADIADNVPSIVQYDREKFANLYVAEKKALLRALVGSGSDYLENKVYQILYMPEALRTI